MLIPYHFNFMENFKTVEVFNPIKATLAAMVEESKKLTCDDLHDQQKLESIKKQRKELRGVEIQIEKIGKDARQDARDYAQKIIDLEKDLKSITSPEISRFDDILEKAEQLKIMEERKLALPVRREKLLAIDDSCDIDDNFLLSLDAVKFEEYYNQCVFQKNERERIAAQKKLDEDNAKLNAERAQLEKEKAEIQRQKDIAAAEERAREQERQRIENEKIAEQKRLQDEADRKAEADRKEKLRLEKEEAKRPDKEKLAKFADVLEQLAMPEMKDSEMIKVANDVATIIGSAVAHIRLFTKV